MDLSYVPFGTLYSNSENSGSDVNDIDGLSNMRNEIEKNCFDALRTSQIISPIICTKESQKIRKTKRNLGMQYISSSGKLKENRKCIPLADCKRKCSTKINYEGQKKIFDEYWKLGKFLIIFKIGKWYCWPL